MIASSARLVEMQVRIRVKPGSSRAKVGGTFGDGELVVAVQARPVDGRATEAALRAVAEALGVNRSAVRLLRGDTARSKVVEVEGDEADMKVRLVDLRNR